MLEPAGGRFDPGFAYRPCEHLLQCRRLRLLGRFQIVDPVERAADELRDGSSQVVVIKLFRRRSLNGYRGARNAGARQSTYGGRERLAPGTAAESLFATEASQQDSCCLYAGQVRE